MQSTLISSLITSLNELKILLEVRESELSEQKKKNERLELNNVDLTSSLEGYRSRCLELEKQLQKTSVLLGEAAGALIIKKVDKTHPRPKKSKSKSSESDSEDSEETIPNTPTRLIKTLGLKFDGKVGLFHSETSLVFKVFNIKGTDELVCIGRLGTGKDGEATGIHSIYGSQTKFWNKKLNALAAQKKIGYLLDLADEYSRLGLEDRTKMSLRGLANF